MSEPKDTDIDIHTDFDTKLDLNASTHTDSDTDSDSESDSWDYDKLVSTIERCIDPDSDVSVMQGAITTNEMLPDRDENHNIRNGTSCMLAEHVLTVAMKTPYNHPSQVRLALYVQAMMKSEKLAIYVADETGKKVESFKDGFHDCWETFWWTICEWFPSCGNDEEVNLSAFCARLYGLNLNGWMIDPTYFIRALGELECNMGSKRTIAENSITRAAALWVLYSGQFAFDIVVKWPGKISRQEGGHQPGYLYNGPLYGIQRWDFWRGRFLEEAANEKVDEETKQLARKAADMMTAVLRNSV